MMENETASKLYEIVPANEIALPAGFRAGALHCGIRKTERNDLGAIWCETEAQAAAVYTTNLFQAAPIRVTKDSLKASRGILRAVVVNSGNANACTGEQGEADAQEMRARLAERLGVPNEHVAVASTGVIGELLNMDRVRDGIDRLPDQLSGDADGLDSFCQAILTTDLVKKSASVTLNIEGRKVTITGAAKGSGMIHPNMATMLAFVMTDANIGAGLLQEVLREVTDATFNMITVDGDTSTNDMLLVMASGLAGHQELTPEHPDFAAFASGLRHVCEELAKAIARDGEGATKLVETVVAGAESTEAARAIAKTIIGSSLVKSAIFGADANWGRIIAAIGRAGVPVNTKTVDIRLGDILVLEQSRPVGFDEAEALEYLKTNDTIGIYVNLHMGEASATAWGCDLTYDYVRINASYRT
jgi:glutamate N-acetyltransferase/amino-acid N-acetyltransferase